MDWKELPEYLETLSILKKKYEGQIEVNIGLEIEYYPSMLALYEELYTCPELEFLCIGQHYFIDEKGRHTLDVSEEERDALEAECCTELILKAMDTGLFPYIAHPDRMFRRKDHWTRENTELSLRVIQKAREEGIWLEQNLESCFHKGQYWKEFWDLTDDRDLVVMGSDAHRFREMICVRKGQRVEESAMDAIRRIYEGKGTL